MRGMIQAQASVVLADYAQVSDGKLTIVGGGWTELSTPTAPTAVAVLLYLPWSGDSRIYKVGLELLDADGYPFLGYDGTPLRVDAELQVDGREATASAGKNVAVPFSCLVPPLELKAGQSYEWRLFLDNETRDDWRQSFTVRAS